MDFDIDYDQEMARHADRLDTLLRLAASLDDLGSRDKVFATDLLQTFKHRGALSANQWTWVERLLDRVTGIEPLYGDFKAILVAFRLAGEHTSHPKIRLMAESGRYVQLNFYPDTQTVKVFVDGWQGHGYRKFAGAIEDDLIKPYSSDRMTEEVKTVIQNLAMDPVGVAKAMAGKLGACMYCGRRLSDARSKQHGYGKTCAEHYGLAWDAGRKKGAK